MRVETALELVNNALVFFPNWEISADDHRKRFEESICVKFNITDARRSERELAPDYTKQVPGGARSAFPIFVGDIKDVEELIGRVLDAAIENFCHEAREFMRVRGTNWAPFHPHKEDGIQRWCARTGRDPQRDYLFGIA